MKKIIFILLGLFNFAVNAQDLIIPTFLEKWENSKNYLIRIAEAMPEEDYRFKPTEREMTFQEQLLHIKANMDWLKTYFTDGMPAKDPLKKTSYGKQETLQLLREAFDSVGIIVKNIQADELSEKVAFFAGQKTKLQILNLLSDHVTHHRGQLIVYLNLNNIKPPKYIGW